MQMLPVGARVTAKDAPAEYAGWIWFVDEKDNKNVYRPIDEKLLQMYMGERFEKVMEMTMAEIQPNLGEELYDAYLAQHADKDETFLIVEGTRHMIKSAMAIQMLGFNKDMAVMTSEADLLKMPEGSKIDMDNMGNRIM